MRRDIRFERWQVLKVPAFLNGKIVRAVEAWDQNGGHLQAPEVWCGHHWVQCLFSGEGPNLLAVMEAPLATTEQLCQHCVPDDPLPTDYSPLFACPHCA